jgi:hypothetical protein
MDLCSDKIKPITSPVMYSKTIPRGAIRNSSFINNVLEVLENETHRDLEILDKPMLGLDKCILCFRPVYFYDSEICRKLIMIRAVSRAAHITT